MTKAERHYLAYGPPSHAKVYHYGKRRPCHEVTEWRFEGTVMDLAMDLARWAKPKDRIRIQAGSIVYKFRVRPVQMAHGLENGIETMGTELSWPAK